MGGNPTYRTAVRRSNPTLSLGDAPNGGLSPRSRRFIGRIPELDVLADARRGLARGRGSIILIDGEAGIGKSRLVAQALLPVGGGRGSRIVTVECVREAGAELAPLRAALATMWLPPVEDAPPLVARAIAQLLPDAAGAELVARYAGATLGKTELFAGLTGALALLSAKRGTILVLEDIHWADSTSLEFLAALAPRIDTMRLLILATSRSESFERSDALADVVSRLLRAPSVRHVQLQPLLRTEVTDLIDDALDGRNMIVPSVVAAIVERCEGNPFFAEELLKAALTPDAGRATLPTSIRASIRHRLSALSPDDRAMLEVAAVLGVRFDHTLLGHLTARPPADVFRMLRAARTANIVDEDGTTFRFHHALTRETIYDGLLTAETRELHRRILAALEAQPDDDSRIEARAYHAWQAGDAPATERYSERAGDRARERGMFSDARTFYERISCVAADDAVRARIHERLGAIATARGDFAASIAALEAAFALRVARGELDDAARIAVALSVERSNSGGDPIPLLDDFLDTYALQLSDAARDGVMIFIARLMTAMGQFDRAGALLQTVTATDALEPRVRANAITCRLNLSEHRGAADAWREAARDMLALAPELPPLMRSIALTTVAQTGAWLGEGTIASDALAYAQEIAQQWGFESLFIFTRAVEAQLAYLTGDLARAKLALDAVERRPDVAPAQVLAARIGPFVAAALQNTGLAERYLRGERAQAIAASDDDEDMLFFHAGMLVAGNASALRTHREQLALRLSDRPGGGIVAPPVAIAAAQYLDEVRLPDLMRSATAHPANNAGAEATRHLMTAIITARTGGDPREPASRATAAFERIGWPLFAAVARRLAGNKAPMALETRLLTAREREIAALVATGSTNGAIAARLSVGVKTVEKHVSSILAKIGARSRAQIAAFIAAGPSRVASDSGLPASGKTRAPSSAGTFACRLLT